MKYLKILKILIPVLLVLALVLSFIKIKNLQDKYEIAKTNELAYSIENSKLKESNIQFEYTVAQLNYSNDSLVKKLNDARKQIKIKDKEIKNLSYLKDEITKVDTIELIKHTIDTVIVERVDTTLGDDWYKLHLTLEPPSTAIVEPMFISEKFIIASTKKVPINPHKCKFVNFFRKKMKIVEVDVIENNPYIINKQQKFIEVVK